MATIYKIVGGGQQVRHNQSYGLNTYYEVCEDSDYPEKAKCNGQDHYTDEMWHTDLETLQDWAKKWAGCEVELIKKENYELQ